MPALPVITYPNKKLTLRSEEVLEITPAIKDLVSSMFETIYQDHGVGMAAVQVGHLKRICTIDCSEDKSEPICMINPVITSYSSNMSTSIEGCLSLPKAQAKVERPADVTVEYLDIDGNKQTKDLSGLLARCVQHEIDHMDGILFIKHIPIMARQSLLKKYMKNKIAT